MSALNGANGASGSTEHLIKQLVSVVDDRIEQFFAVANCAFQRCGKRIVQKLTMRCFNEILRHMHIDAVSIRTCLNTRSPIRDTRSPIRDIKSWCSHAMLVVFDDEFYTRFTQCMVGYASLYNFSSSHYEEFRDSTQLQANVLVHRYDANARDADEIWSQLMTCQLELYNAAAFAEICEDISYRGDRFDEFCDTFYTKFVDSIYEIAST
jgi:hypothetical protein